MGLYIVTLPQGAYTVKDGSKSRLVVADNSTDAVAIAGTFTDSDGAPWDQATAVLCAGSADFSRYKFGFSITHDSDNGFGSNKHITYTPLSTDAVADIGAGLVAACTAAGVAGVTYNSGSHNVILPTSVNCGKSVITVDTPVWHGESAAQSGIGGNDFADITLTGTSIKPTIDAASVDTAATIRNIGLTPITTGINPTALAEIVGGF